MTVKNATNAFEQGILDNIARFGWHSNSVGMEVDSAIFAYTVGFFSSFRHPELLVFGLSPKSAHGIFTAAATLITRGRKLDANEINDELLAGRSCVAAEVPKALHEDFALSACWYYDGDEFPVYQVIWTSDEGHYPWNPRATEAFVRNQPVLGQFGSPILSRSAPTMN